MVRPPNLFLDPFHSGTPGQLPSIYLFNSYKNLTFYIFILHIHLCYRTDCIVRRGFKRKKKRNSHNVKPILSIAMRHKKSTSKLKPRKKEKHQQNPLPPKKNQECIPHSDPLRNYVLIFTTHVSETGFRSGMYLSCINSSSLSRPRNTVASPR